MQSHPEPVIYTSELRLFLVHMQRISTLSNARRKTTMQGHTGAFRDPGSDLGNEVSRGGMEGRGGSSVVLNDGSRRCLTLHWFSKEEFVALTPRTA